MRLPTLSGASRYNARAQWLTEHNPDTEKDISHGLRENWCDVVRPL